jgi:phosphohistidine phosphatase
VRTLFLLRHAKSSWDDPAVADHDRPLAPRGVTAAARIAQHLRAADIRPDLVLCSTSRRTRQTLDLLDPALGPDTEVSIEDALYGGSADDLLDRLRRIESHRFAVIVIGHNPGIQDLAIELAGDGDESALAQVHAKFPTAALATLEFAAPWEELGPGQASLTSMVLSRELR